MIKILSCILLLCVIATPLRAEYNYNWPNASNSDGNEYSSIANQPYTTSIIYVFYDSQTCDENCARAIAAIESVYNEYFMNQYQFFIIDYYNDEENNFIYAYNLETALSMVLQKVEYGQPTTFRKYPGLNNVFVEGPSFTDEIRQDIQYFFED